MAEADTQGVTPEFKDDSQRAAIRALRGLEQTALMLEAQAPEIFGPPDELGQVPFGHAIMIGAATSIRDSWKAAIKDVETSIVDDPVEHLSAKAAREEVRFWRAEAAATLEMAMSLLTSHRKNGNLDQEAELAVGQFNPLRRALQDAIAGEYFERCESCLEPVREGDLVVDFADVGEVHARCCGVEGEDLRAGFEIPVGPESLELDEGEDIPANPCLTVFAHAEHYTHDKVAEILAKALAFDRDDRACRICGCTDDRACDTAGGPCHWVETDLCSNPNCVAKAAAAGAPS